MDFKTASEILESVHERVNHGIFGYTNIKDHYEDANLWLDPGNIFGRVGEMFQRINVATSREYLEKGLKALVENLLKP